MYTVRDVRDRLGVSDQMVYKLVRTGKLPAYKVGRLVKIEPRDLDAYLARNRK